MIPSSTYRGYLLQRDTSQVRWGAYQASTCWFSGASEAEVRALIDEAEEYLPE